MSLEKSVQDPQAKLSEWRDLIHSRLSAEGSSSSCDSKTLQASVSYVLQGHGKRLRGLLALSIQCDVSRGDDARRALQPALALEMLHAASLVHDDLPALDNDDMRRGRPSCHRAFNEATAILTGDYLVGRALSVAAGGVMTPMQQLRVLSTLAQAWSDVCVGQQLDIERPTQSGQVLRLMELKTGALFGAAAACGAICAECDQLQATRFQKWGERVGVLFQKLDDMADGDGVIATGFNKGEQIVELLGELRACHPHALLLTEAVFHEIVGGHTAR